MAVRDVANVRIGGDLRLVDGRELGEALREVADTALSHPSLDVVLFDLQLETGVLSFHTVAQLVGAMEECNAVFLNALLAKHGSIVMQRETTSRDARSFMVGA